MNPPDIIPIAKDITTFFVANASIIATSGGINVNAPYLSALTWSISTSSANAITVDIMNIIIDINATFDVLFFIFSS